MKSNENHSTLVQYRASIAIKILRDNVESIPNVQVWADMVGVSRRWLSSTMKSAYGKSPKEILREIKFEKVVSLISEEGMKAGCFSVALDAGFKSAAGLSKFLTAFYALNFTTLKTEVISDVGQLTFNWLEDVPKKETYFSKWKQF